MARNSSRAFFVSPIRVYLYIHTARNYHKLAKNVSLLGTPVVRSVSNEDISTVIAPTDYSPYLNFDGFGK